AESAAIERDCADRGIAGESAGVKDAARKDGDIPAGRDGIGGAEREPAGFDEGAADVIVGRVREREGAGAGLDEAAGTSDLAVPSEGGSAILDADGAA